MKRTAGVAHQWARWMGGAAVVLALLALLTLRDRSGLRAGEGQRAGELLGRGPSASGSVEGEQRSRAGNLPRFLSQTSDKPEEQHNLALAMQARARASGSRVPKSSELFAGEARDPVWAPAMERVLTDRFRRDREVLAAAGLKSTVIQEPECHTSTCRFEIHYSEQELAQAREAGVFTEKLAPSGYLFQNTGPFARSWSDYRTEPIEVVDGVTRMKQIIDIVFGGQESDPGSYAAWVAEARREMAHQRSLGPKVPTKGLPPLVDLR